VQVSGAWGSAEDKIWAEQIEVTSPETKVLMRYGKSNGWLDDQPAAVTRQLGKGSITYVGAGLDAGAMERAARWMIGQAGVQPVFPEAPVSVDVAVRSGEGKRIVILTNYGPEEQTITLPASMQDVLTGQVETSVQLPQYGVAVLSGR
jgi:beta-galactosidase